jgi:8-oxo-dGTP pyrophosphatase MutT (NUDIX family)
MGIKLQGHKIHINLTIPLPYKYRGGGVAVFRTNGNTPEVLLGLRVNNPGRGLWSFPGGGAEYKERLASAALREFREETGVQLYRRYITRTGVFSIKMPFFEWNTLVLESNQNIDPAKRFAANKTVKEHGGTFDADEFLFMRWVPVSETSGLKLHRWVKDVIDFYLSGKMLPYTPKFPELGYPKPKKIKLSERKTLNNLQEFPYGV